MRAYEDLAEKAAAKAWDAQWEGTGLSPEKLSWSPDDLKSIWAKGYIAGFKKAREHAAGLIGSFPNPDMRNLAMLVGVIGDAQAES